MKKILFIILLLCSVSMFSQTRYVAVLTQTQKDSLEGVRYAPDSYFNPIQDVDNNWVISAQEVYECIAVGYEWVNNLVLSVYKPKPSPPRE